MSKVKSFKVTVNNAISLANTVSSNLTNGWQIDTVYQNNHNNSGNAGTGADYFFFMKTINGKNYSLCLNCFQNELTTSVVRDKDNDHEPLPENEWEMVVQEFVKDNLQNLVQVTWIDLNYIK
jgi:hypothetical protein